MSSCIDAVGRKDFSLRSHELEIVKREVSDDREANYFNPRNNTWAHMWQSRSMGEVYLCVVGEIWDLQLKSMSATDIWRRAKNFFLSILIVGLSQFDN